MLYWTVRWKWIAVGLAAVAVIDPDTYPNFSGRLSGKLRHAAAGMFRVLSYNVEGFFRRDPLGKREKSGCRDRPVYPGTEPDIICMQEFELNRSILA